MTGGGISYPSKMQSESNHFLSFRFLFLLGLEDSFLDLEEEEEEEAGAVSPSTTVRLMLTVVGTLSFGSSLKSAVGFANLKTKE